jgi:membrane fusion protein, multidrug efflux system
MKKFLVLLCVLVAFGAGLWVFMAGGQDTRIAIHPAQGPAAQAVYASGTVEPTVMMPIAPRTGSRLMALLVDEGAEVKKGDVLAQMEDTDLQKSAEELAARLDLAEKDFARKDRLRKSGAVSKQSIDEASTALEAAKAALAQIKAQQDYMRLIAPADGRIIRRDGEEGEFIPAGQAVFYMECCAPLRVTTDVDEEDIPLVKVGQKALITADAFAGQTFEGAVRSITPKGDSVSRSYRVRISLPENTPLMTGMTAEANIMIRENPEAILVPASAVHDGKIWIVKDGKISIVPVKTGANDAKGVEILEGAGTQDTLLEKADAKIKDGQRVKSTLHEWSPGS